MSVTVRMNSRQKSPNGRSFRMPLWRIRIAVPDDPGSRSALNALLAAQPAARLREVPGRTARAAAAGEIMVELPEDDDLVGVLSALHQISPQVFVSRADMPDSASHPERVASSSIPRGTG
jgi:hypothetical protein